MGDGLIAAVGTLGPGGRPLVPHHRGNLERRKAVPAVRSDRSARRSLCTPRPRTPTSYLLIFYLVLPLSASRIGKEVGAAKAEETTSGFLFPAFVSLINFVQTLHAQTELRLARAAARLPDPGSALLLTPGADLWYLTGFEHSHAGERLLALVLRQDGSSDWIVPAMNVPQVEPHRVAGQALRAWTDAETFGPALAAAVRGTPTVYFDEEARAGFLLDLLALPNAPAARRSGEILRGLRLCKDTAELAAMRASARVVDDAIPEAVAFCRAGRTELEIAADLCAALVRRAPAATVAFTIVAGGPHSALPHHETGIRPLEPGDVVILDFGVRLHGYLSDITVTCSVGDPRDPEVSRVYRTVWEAQQQAIAAIRPGVPCRDVDAAARSHIQAAGYGEQFLHRTGHGLGIQVHEPPYLVGNNDELLEEGMVFSIEPGIYLADRFGVRLEVIASVTADGVALLNAPSAADIRT